MLIITLHGFGFYGVWLFTGEYTRGLVWDRTGAHQPLILPRLPLQVEASSLHAGHTAWLRLSLAQQHRLELLTWGSWEAPRCLGLAGISLIQGA